MIMISKIICCWKRHDLSPIFKRATRYYYRNEIDNWYAQVEEVYCNRCNKWLEFCHTTREKE